MVHHIVTTFKSVSWCCIIFSKTENQGQTRQTVYVQGERPEEKEGVLCQGRDP